MRQAISTHPPTAHLKDLRRIPGVGLSLARDLWELGYQSVASLANQDAEEMYTALEELRGQPMDRCVLYAFRCAVYFASTDDPEPALLKWWNWKTIPPR